MSGNEITTGSDTVLSWPKRLLSADDLRRHLNGQREVQLLPRTVVTPLAADELRARGVRITTQSTPLAVSQQRQSWSYAQETPDSLISSAVQSLEREGIVLPSLPSSSVRDLALSLTRGDSAGLIFFCAEPAVICCIADKHAGVRAAPVLNAAQAVRARTSLAANLCAVEMPGRTYFELRQIVRSIAGTPPLPCPAALAATLQELDGHAHR